MRIENHPPKDLRAYAANPRVNTQAVQGVARSIEAYGFRQPIVTNSEMIILAGHTRLEAAILLGLDSVPVLIVDDLTPEQAKGYRIADNKTHEASTWDWDLLKDELRELQASDFDLALTGFEELELKRILEDADLEDYSDEDSQAFNVVVNLENEEQQRSCYEFLIREGYSCRVQTL